MEDVTIESSNIYLTSNISNLNVGDTIDIQINSQYEQVTITGIDSNIDCITVDKCFDSNIDIGFLYGQVVNDFRTLDKDIIFTHGIVAIQELSKKIDILTSNIAVINSKLGI